VESFNYFESPIGFIEIKASENGISSLIFCEHRKEKQGNHPLIDLCFSQLDEYFSGARTEFDLPLDLRGTDFQQRVWKLLLNIPFGETTSYLDLSKKYGDTNTLRAIGSANGKNPVSIIVPCHRVIGNDGSLTGYAGGLWRKKWLLEHESKYTQLELF
jgi:methylated-DNA-[protein]-cysteine S-methyltransferase